MGSQGPDLPTPDQKLLLEEYSKPALPWNETLSALK